MKKVYRIILTVIMIEFIFSSAIFAEKLDQVIAIVDDEIITASELGKMVAPIYFQYKNSYAGEELQAKMAKVQEDALKRLIENKLLVQEGKKDEEIEVSQRELKDEILKIKKRFSSEEEFKKALKQDKTPIEELEGEIKDQLLIQKVLARKVYAKVFVSPKDVEAYYQQFPKKFREGEKVNIYHILIKKAEDPEKAKEKIDEVLKLLHEGEDFKLLAKKYSEGPNADKGGEVNFFERGYMLKEIEDVAFLLEVGKYSDIIETKIGYHLVYLIAKKKGKITELKEAWVEIENNLYQKQVGEKYKEYLTSLRSKAYITIVR